MRYPNTVTYLKLTVSGRIVYLKLTAKFQVHRSIFSILPYEKGSLLNTKELVPNNYDIEQDTATVNSE
jgi:hypothetical protein